MQYQQKVVLLILFSFGLRAAAQTPPASPPEVLKAPRLVENVGEPLRLEFPDGRVAVFKRATGYAPRVRQTFTIADNTCSNRQNMTCEYVFPLRHYGAWMVWAAHPDPTKINQVVKYRYQGGIVGNPLSFFQSVTGFPGLSEYEPDSFKLPPHEITCPDFSWLPTREKAAPANLWITALNSEENSSNAETGVSENRIVASYFGVNLAKTADQTMSVQGVDSAAPYRLDTLFSSASETATLVKTPGEFCQVNFATKDISVREAVSKALDQEMSSKLGAIPAYVYHGPDKKMDQLVQNLFSSVNLLNGHELQSKDADHFL